LELTIKNKLSNRNHGCTVFYVRLTIKKWDHYSASIYEKLQIDIDEFKNIIEKIGGKYHFPHSHALVIHEFPTKKQAQQFVDYLEPYMIMKKLTM
jgi:hypothetical protein